MRGAFGWIIATVLTFLVVSLAFLVLANLATNPPEVSLIPNQSGATSGPPLSLTLDEAALTELEAAEDQSIALTVENRTDEAMPEMTLAAQVRSEDTSNPSPDTYRQTIEDLAPGASREVVFDLDLSERDNESPDYPEGARQTLEFRASIPEGASVFETVILPAG